MTGSRWRRKLGLLALSAGLLATGGTAQERAKPKVEPKFEVVAETRLLMEGLAQPNYLSVQRILKQKPADAETWTFARGQALLIAETGNLLLLRPPRNQGRDTWMQKAMDMRKVAATLARNAGNRDLEGSRAALVDLATACNRCHQTFRVPVRVGPEPAPREGAERDAE
jgi:hypothetical protein